MCAERDYDEFGYGDKLLQYGIDTYMMTGRVPTFVEATAALVSSGILPKHMGAPLDPDDARVMNRLFLSAVGERLAALKQGHA